MTRIENDFIGQEKIPEKALFGLQSLRAKNNFPHTTQFNIEWYKAMGVVKQACFQTILAYKKAMNQNYPELNSSIQIPSNEVLNLLQTAAIEISEGKYAEFFIVPAISGGAGTSINMNINEILANRALQLNGDTLGDYSKIDPIEDANIFQSTNDVVPTALRVAIMRKLELLETSINSLRAKIEILEGKHRQSLRIAYTQMQEAVPSSFGKLFSTYSDALSRDWWRVSKCNERIKQVNLGGSAVGTGITVPRYFVMEAARNLQKITDLPLTRAENMQDATANLDVFVEVHAIMKSHAVNLEKIVSDMRLLASDLVQGGIAIPQRQIGSSIMPGKVNPVIPEFVISAVQRIYSNDNLVTSLCGQGCLDLNAYIPTIGNAMLDSLELLIASCETLEKNLFDEIFVDTKNGVNHLLSSSAITTALLPFIGYHKAAELGKEMKNSGCDIFSANKKLKLLSQEKLEQLMQPDKLLKAGFTADDLKNMQ